MKSPMICQSWAPDTFMRKPDVSKEPKVKRGMWVIVFANFKMR